MHTRPALLAVATLLALLAVPAVTPADTSAEPVADAPDGPAASGASDVQPDEEALELHADPGHVDTVSVYVPADGTDPEALARRIASNADIPVYGVTTESVNDRVGVHDGSGNLESERTYLRLTIETEFAEERGLLQREIPVSTRTALSPSGSPSTTLELPRGLTVDEADGERRRAGVTSQTYEIHGIGAVDYEFPRDRLPWLFGALLASALVPYVLGRIYGRRLGASDSSTTDRRQQLYGARTYGTAVFVPAAAGGGLLAGALGLASLLFDAYLPVQLAGTWWGVTGQFLALTPFAASALLATRLGIRPALNRVGTAERSRIGTTLASGRLFATAVAALWIGAVVVQTVPRWAIANPISIGLVAGALVALNGTVSPHLTRLIGRSRAADEALREEVQHVWDGSEAAVRNVYEAGGLRPGERGVELTGELPDRHDVYLTDEFRESFDAAERRALLAHELGHVVHGHLAKRVAVAAGFSFVGLLLFRGMLPGDGLGPFLVVTVPLAIIGRGWIAVLQEHQADDYAASVTDVETVVSALETLEALETSDGTDVVSMRNGPFTAGPSVSDRIDQLRRQRDDQAVAERDGSEEATGESPNGDRSSEERDVREANP